MSAVEELISVQWTYWLLLWSEWSLPEKVPDANAIALFRIPLATKHSLGWKYL